MAIGTSNPPLAIIAGPTASGKSALALALAERSRGVIINADSAQVYRELKILSAAPSAEDQARAEHRLFGFLPGTKPCSAAAWARLARLQIHAAHRVGRLPIVVGGTGLYLRTLLEGIAPVPPIDPEVRRRIRLAPVCDNLAELRRADPEAAARLDPGDTTRIARALEVIQSTGETLAYWQQRKKGGVAREVSLRAILLLPPRPWLFERCDARFAAMFEAGAVDEVRRLLDLGYDPAVPVMRAIGVREIAAWLRGETSREQAIAAGQQATRRYAKRQYTWFKHQPPADWPCFEQPLDGAVQARALELLGAKD
jgi:tRNA dimethylallyltransferase